MDISTKPTGPGAPVFQVYLRLKPPVANSTSAQIGSSRAAERYLKVGEPDANEGSSGLTHITITPPSETSRRRAVEKFAFTRVFQESSDQREIFRGTNVESLVEGVLGSDGQVGRDGLLATLGVTGSGKTHTILGSRTQRGMTQMSLDLVFSSLGDNVLHPATSRISTTLAASDASEAQIVGAMTMLDETSIDGANQRSNTRHGMNETNHGVFGTPRKQAPQGLSTLPKIPSVDNVNIKVDSNSEYAVLVSMYEVYNDRIFDLLAGSAPSAATSTTRQANANREFRRRPLLFKSTEQSPDRKLVAGLRKVICGNLAEALSVLEIGLTERRIAGTGSNSVSSRSHGFFCIEVKKRNRSMPDMWWGSTLTIVDLAGSERARNAKTAGATLAEAGKINESLMYLGQCLQMQSDCQDGFKPSLVPFRQCKLTELLFSNSFPTSSSNLSHYHAPVHRAPQKAIMIVTADPLGDFNATSQILRYSALAREVTVPRIPSVTSTILSGLHSKGNNENRSVSGTASGEELEHAAHEIAKLSEEVEILQLRLSEEEERRREAERAWKAAEERCVEVEQEVRDECWANMEKMMDRERARWKGIWGEQLDRNDEHLDKKLEILNRSVQIYEDPETLSNNQINQLQDENETLRSKVAILERDLQCRSPTKTPKAKKGTLTENLNLSLSFGDSFTERLQNSPPVGDFGKGALKNREKLREISSSSPGKKMRKFTTRKWDLGPEEESTL